MGFWRDLGRFLSSRRKPWLWPSFIALALTGHRHKPANENDMTNNLRHELVEEDLRRVELRMDDHGYVTEVLPPKIQQEIRRN
jgi:hypothetical protein